MKGTSQYDPRSSQPMIAIVRVALVVVTLALFLSSLFSAYQGQREISILLALATPLGLSAWGFARAGHNEAAIGLLCCVLITVVTLILVLNPLGVHDMAVTAYGGIVLVGALLLSRRGFLAIAVFTIFAATAAFVADIAGFSRSRISHITAWPQYVDFVLILGVLIVVGRTAAEELFGSLGDAHRASSTDIVSGLLNRPGFMMTSAMRLRRALMENRSAVLVVCDIDEFRRTNVTIGHEAGDRVLAEAARRLAAACGDGASVIGRVGDDEFAVLAFGVDAEAAPAFARDIHGSMNFDYMGVSVRSAAGFACFPRDAHGIEPLMLAAQSGLGAAKAGATEHVSGPIDRI